MVHCIYTSVKSNKLNLISPYKNTSLDWVGNHCLAAQCAVFQHAIWWFWMDHTALQHLLAVAFMVVFIADSGLAQTCLNNGG